jgi:hypothetical protein
VRVQVIAPRAQPAGRGEPVIIVTILAAVFLGGVVPTIERIS